MRCLLILLILLLVAACGDQVDEPACTKQLPAPPPLGVATTDRIRYEADGADGIVYATATGEGELGIQFRMLSCVDSVLAHPQTPWVNDGIHGMIVSSAGRGSVVTAVVSAGPYALPVGVEIPLLILRGVEDQCPYIDRAQVGSRYVGEPTEVVVCGRIQNEPVF